MKSAEKTLNEMLQLAAIPRKPSYRPDEVQKILGISERTFRRMVAAYEPDPLTGELRTPVSLDSFKLCRSRRVTYMELAAYLERNQSWERENTL